MNLTATPDRNGVLIYTLPSGTSLFRGAKEPHANYLRGATIKFFALTAAEAEQYGDVNTFRTTRDLRLVALDQPNDAFYDAAGDTEVEVFNKKGKKVDEKSVKHILNRYYGFKKEKQIRNSVNSYDSAIVRYICSIGYDGYAIINRMDVDFGGKFHQEVAICTPSRVTEHTDNLRTPVGSPAAAAAAAASAEQVPVISSPPPALKGVKSNLFGDFSPSPTKVSASPPPHQTRRRKTPSPPRRKTRRALFDSPSPPRRGGRKTRRRGALKKTV